MMRHLDNPETLSTLSEYLFGDVQPNAIDVRMDRVYSISDHAFILDEDKKVHREITELTTDVNGYYVLDIGVYSVTMAGRISIDENEAGWIITRSTLNRNGCHLTTGLYDSGYEGPMVATLHVTCGPAKIKKNARVGQFLIFDAESVGKYDGDYAKNKVHSKRYE